MLLHLCAWHSAFKNANQQHYSIEMKLLLKKTQRLLENGWKSQTTKGEELEYLQRTRECSGFGQMGAGISLANKI